MSLLDLPFVFGPAARLRNARLGKHCWVTPQSDLVIEGYPRSANTYLHRVIRAATGDRLKIANHVHRPQQVAMALRYDVPCFVLVRAPADAVASYLVREPELDLPGALRDYIAFAEMVLKHHDNPLLRIVPFERVIADIVPLSNAMLAALDLPATVTAELVAEATRDTRKERHRASVPTPEKEQAKAQQADRIAAQLDLPRAAALYQRCLDQAWAC